MWYHLFSVIPKETCDIWHNCIFDFKPCLLAFDCHHTQSLTQRAMQLPFYYLYILKSTVILATANVARDIIFCNLI